MLTEFLITLKKAYDSVNTLKNTKLSLNVVLIMQKHTHTSGPGLREIPTTLALWNKIVLIFSFSVIAQVLKTIIM